MEQNPTRLIKVVNINPYLNNMAKFNWSIYFTSIIVVATTIFSSLLFSIYFFESTDYLKALDKVEASMIVIFKYFTSYMIGALNNLNHFNDLFGLNIFNFQVEIQSPNLSFQGWLLIGISCFFALAFHILNLYQYYAQRIIKSSGYFNYYIPYVLLHKFWNRKKNGKLYIRILPLVKLEKINKTDFNMLMQNFFNIDIENIEKYEIRIESKRILWWFDYQILHLIKVEPKNKQKGILNDNKKEISANAKSNKQNPKVSNDNGKPKKFFI